jgi:CBS domain-containing protein
VAAIRALKGPLKESPGTPKETPVIARDVMTADPMTLSPQASVAEAWNAMRELDVRHIPIVDRGALVGMISDRDVARVIHLLAAGGASELKDELATPIARVMSTAVVSVGPDTDLGEVVELLLEEKIGALPVVHPDTLDVLGIVSYVDVLRALRDLLEAE